MAGITANIDAIKRALYLEIQKADRTGSSLIEQGYARSHVQYCMPRLIKEALIYKHGAGKSTYYSANKVSNSRNVDPVITPDYEPALAFRMGYAMYQPTNGRLIKGLTL
jgi:hypothetical protein